jgi:hypothetical protein
VPKSAGRLPDPLVARCAIALRQHCHGLFYTRLPLDWKFATHRVGSALWFNRPILIHLPVPAIAGAAWRCLDHRAFDFLPNDRDRSQAKTIGSSEIVPQIDHPGNICSALMFFLLEGRSPRRDFANHIGPAATPRSRRPPDALPVPAVAWRLRQYGRAAGAAAPCRSVCSGGSGLDAARRSV